MILYYYFLSKKNVQFEFIISLDIWDPITDNIYLKYLWLFFYLKPYLQNRFYLFKLLTFRKNFKKTPKELLIKILIKLLLYYIYILLTGLTKTFIKYSTKIIDLYFNYKQIEKNQNKDIFFYSFIERNWTLEVDELFSNSKLEIKIKNKEIIFKLF